MSALFFLLAVAASPSAAVDPNIVVVPQVAVRVSAPDPARIAIARNVAGRMLPDGTFEKLMSSMLGGLMKRITDGMMDMPLKSIVGMGGVDAAKMKDLGPGTMRQITAILDSAFDQRMEIMTGVMGPEMGKLMTTMEPSFREGLAEAYANRFSEDELKKIDVFFREPAGEKFAQQLMTIQSDPAFLNKMQDLMPRLMQGMPAIMKKVEEATATLPKPRKPQDLNPAEKAELNKLLGISPAKVK